MAISLFFIFIIRSLNIALVFWVLKTKIAMFYVSSVGLVLSELIPSCILFILLMPSKEDEEKSLHVGQEVAGYGTPAGSTVFSPLNN